MTTATALVWLFGAAAWGSLCNIPAWTFLFFERWRVHTVPFYRDKYLVVRFAMVMMSLGIGAGSWQRGASVIANPDRQIPLLISFFGWLPHPLPAWSPFVWSGSLLVAEGLFVWVSALNAHSARRVPLAWWVYVAGMVAWAAVVAVFFWEM